jgi:hypothetical protein
VALVKTNASEERITFNIIVTRIRELGTLAVASNFTRPHIPEDGTLHNHRRENLKSYICSLLLLLLELNYIISSVFNQINFSNSFLISLFVCALEFLI